MTLNDEVVLVAVLHHHLPHLLVLVETVHLPLPRKDLLSPTLDYHFALGCQTHTALFPLASLLLDLHHLPLVE